MDKITLGKENNNTESSPALNTIEGKRALSKFLKTFNEDVKMGNFEKTFGKIRALSNSSGAYNLCHSLGNNEEEKTIKSLDNTNKDFILLQNILEYNKNNGNIITNSIIEECSLPIDLKTIQLFDKSFNYNYLQISKYLKKENEDLVDILKNDKNGIITRLGVSENNFIELLRVDLKFMSLGEGIKIDSGEVKKDFLRLISEQRLESFEMKDLLDKNLERHDIMNCFDGIYQKNSTLAKELNPFNKNTTSRLINNNPLVLNYINEKEFKKINFNRLTDQGVLNVINDSSNFYSALIKYRRNEEKIKKERDIPFLIENTTDEIFKKNYKTIYQYIYNELIGTIEPKKFLPSFARLLKYENSNWGKVTTFADFTQDNHKTLDRYLDITEVCNDYFYEIIKSLNSYEMSSVDAISNVNNFLLLMGTQLKEENLNNPRFIALYKKLEEDNIHKGNNLNEIDNYFYKYSKENGKIELRDEVMEKQINSIKNKREIKSLKKHVLVDNKYYYSKTNIDIHYDYSKFTLEEFENFNIYTKDNKKVVHNKDGDKIFETINPYRASKAGSKDVIRVVNDKIVVGYAKLHFQNELDEIFDINGNKIVSKEDAEKTGKKIFTGNVGRDIYYGDDILS